MVHFFPERRIPLSVTVIRPLALHFREAGRLVSAKETKGKIIIRGGKKEMIGEVKGSGANRDQGRAFLAFSHRPFRAFFPIHQKLALSANTCKPRVVSANARINSVRAPTNGHSAERTSAACPPRFPSAASRIKSSLQPRESRSETRPPPAPKASRTEP